MYVCVCVYIFKGQIRALKLKALLSQPLNWVSIKCDFPQDTISEHWMNEESATSMKCWDKQVNDPIYDLSRTPAWHAQCKKLNLHHNCLSQTRSGVKSCSWLMTVSIKDLLIWTAGLFRQPLLQRPNWSQTQGSSCLCLPDAGIKGVCHQTKLFFSFFLLFFRSFFLCCHF